MIRNTKEVFVSGGLLTVREHSETLLGAVKAPHLDGGVGYTGVRMFVKTYLIAF